MNLGTNGVLSLGMTTDLLGTALPLGGIVEISAGEGPVAEASFYARVMRLFGFDGARLKKLMRQSRWWTLLSPFFSYNYRQLCSTGGVTNYREIVRCSYETTFNLSSGGASDGRHGRRGAGSQHPQNGSRH